MMETHVSDNEPDGTVENFRSDVGSDVTHLKNSLS